MAERLYRSMKRASDGYPEPGRTARTLGVRPGIDIPVGADGVVVRGGGGMSVAPDSPDHLPAHRRPPQHGGTGKDPIWVLNVADLEPMLPTTFGTYESALLRTRRAWRLL